MPPNQSRSRTKPSTGKPSQRRPVLSTSIASKFLVAKLGHPEPEGLAQRDRGATRQLHVGGAEPGKIVSGEEVPTQLITEHSRLPPICGEIPPLPIHIVHQDRVVEPVVAQRIVDRYLNVAVGAPHEPVKMVAERGVRD